MSFDVENPLYDSISQRNATERNIGSLVSLSDGRFGSGASTSKELQFSPATGINIDMETEFSACIWIRHGSGSSTRTFVDTRQGSSSTGWLFGLYNSDSLIVQLRDTSFVNYVSDSFPVPWSSQWHHACVSINRTSTTGLRFYYDGTLLSSHNPTSRSGSLQSSSQVILFGQNSGASGYTDDVDEFVFFHGALSAEQIQLLYNRQCMESVPVCYRISATASSACSSHGVCTGDDNCVCDNGWIGTRCQTKACFGISPSDASVCSAHGDCIDVDTCSCNTGWTSFNCSVHECYGTRFDDPLVCQGHGDCTTLHQCSCNTNYGGEECGLSFCFGIRSDNATVCSNSHGSCVSPNNCSCNTGYTGSQCEYVICNGVESHEAGICSGHGDCLSPDTCDCHAGYGGPNCEFRYCFGTLSNQTHACSGNGTCVGVNNCECDNEHGGFNCQYDKCFGVLSTNGSVCSSHGTCTSPDVCLCDTNYGGNACEFVSCSGILSNESSVCSARGNCSNVNHCLCEKGYGGDNCELNYCFGVLSNESAIVCSGRGVCSSPNNCTCTSLGFTGTHCNTPFTCFGLPSTNDAVCGGHGSCVNWNTCRCDSNNWDHNHDGTICTVPMCYGVRADENHVCSGRGECVDAQTCNCELGWTENCSVPICFGVSANNSEHVCSGHGECIAPNQCRCVSPAYTDYNCNTFLCHGLLNTQQDVCSGHGSCVDADTCLCQDGWVTGNCSVPECFGIPANIDQVCSHHGSCVAPNDCQCVSNAEEGYWSKSSNNPACNECAKNYQSPATGCKTAFCSNDVTCSGNGVCNDIFRCNCFQNDQDGYFVGEFCSQCQDGYVNYPHCNTTCSQCNGHGKCHEATGECVCDASVKDGFYSGASCSECAPNFYGNACNTFVSKTWRFSNSLDRITGQLIHATPRNYLDCRDLVHELDITKLGSSPTCQWSNRESNQFEIILDSGATLAPHGTIRFNVLVGDASLSVNQQVNHYIMAQALPASSPVRPVAFVSAPRVIGSCSPLFIDASASYSSDGRALSFEFTCLNGTGCDALNQFFETNSVATLSLSNAQLTVGDEYEFQLRVKNFVGIYSDATRFSVRKSADMMPYSRIRGGSKQILHTSGYNALDGTSFSTECLHTARDIFFKWIQVSGPDAGRLDTIANGKKLVFRQHQLKAGYDYIFELRVHLTANPSVYASSRTTVTVVQKPLHVEIIGGNRFLPSGVEFVLNGTASHDPDHMDGVETFSWTCKTKSSGGMCGRDAPLESNGKLLIVPGSLLGEGEYEFSFRMSKSDGRTTATSVTITIVPTGPPLVEIESLPQMVNGQERLRIKSRLIHTNHSPMSNSTIQYMWRLFENSQLLQNIDDFLYTPSLNVTQIGVKENVLRAGNQYTFELIASDLETHKSSRTSRSVHVNMPPRAGTISIVPSTGYAVETEFTLEALQWSDPDSSSTNLIPHSKLTFGWIYEDPSTGEEKLLAQNTISQFIFSHLPVSGLKENDYQVKIGIVVRDSAGGETKLFDSVKVLPVSSKQSGFDILSPLLKLSFESELSLSNKNTEERVRTLQVGSEALNHINMHEVTNCSSLSHFFNMSSLAASREWNASAGCPTDVLENGLMQLKDHLLDRLLYESKNDESPKSSSSLLQESQIIDALMNDLPLARGSSNGNVSFMGNNTLTISLNQTSGTTLPSSSLNAAVRANQHLHYIISEHNYLLTNPIVGSVTSGISKIIGNPLLTKNASDHSPNNVSVVAADSVNLVTRHLIHNQIPHQKASIISKENLKIGVAVVTAHNLLSEASFSFDNETFIRFSPEIYAGNHENNIPSLSKDKVLNVYTFSLALNPYENASVPGTDIISHMTRINIEYENQQKLLVRNLSTPITIRIPGTFDPAQYELNPKKEGWRPLCAYHAVNGSDEFWATDGCKLIHVSRDHAICECTHLTDFATALSYLVPDLEILTFEDVLAIRTLNTDNLTVVIVLSVLFYIYMAGMFILEFVYCCAQSRAKKLQRRLSQKRKIIASNWAFKEGGRVKTWKRRFFKLTAKSLTYGKDGSYNINQILLKDVNDVKKSYLERAPHGYQSNGLKIVVTEEDSVYRTYCVAFDTPTVRDGWFSSLQKAIKDQQNIIKARKPDRGYIRPFWKLLREGHLWISIVFLPSRGSDYTKSQRLTVLYLIILGIMVSNAMSWQGGQKADGTFVAYQYIITGVVADLLSQPFAIVAAFLFSKLRAAGNQMTQDDFNVEDFMDEVKMSRQYVVNSEKVTITLQRDEPPPFVEKGGRKVQSVHGEYVEKGNGMGENVSSFQKVTPPTGTESFHHHEEEENPFWDDEEYLEEHKALNSTLFRLFSLHQAKETANWTIDQLDRVIGVLVRISTSINKKMAISFLLVVSSVIYFGVIALGCWIMIEVITWLEIYATLMFAVGGFCTWLSILMHLYLQAKIKAYLKSSTDQKKWRSGCLAWTNIVISSVFLIVCIVGFISVSVVLPLNGIDFGVVFVIDTFFVGMIPMLSIWLYKHVRIPREEKKSRFRKLMDKKYFPNWFKYPIYLICFLGYSGLSFVLVLYGIKFSNENDTEVGGWWKACVCASFQNMVLTETMQFIISCIIVVYVVQLFEMLLLRKRKTEKKSGASDEMIPPVDPLANRLEAVKEATIISQNVCVPTFDLDPSAWGGVGETEQSSEDSSSGGSSYDEGEETASISTYEASSEDEGE